LNIIIDPHPNQIKMNLSALKINLNDLLCPYNMFKINGSVVKYHDFYLCAYRTAHLYQFDAKNKLTLLDTDFKPIAHRSFSLDDGNTAFEDIRLFTYKSELLALYTFLPKNADGEWDWNFTVGIGIVNWLDSKIIRHRSLRGLATQRHEKNWIPYIYNDELFLITNFEPNLRILHLAGNINELEFKEFHFERVNRKSWKYGILRGGTELFKNPNENSDILYGFVHSSLSKTEDDKLYKEYFYTIVKFSPSALNYEIYPEPIGISEPETDESYKLKHHQSTNGNNFKVVFPMGVIVEDIGVHLSYGKDDCETRLRFFSWEYIFGLFKTTEK
jgi:hypothetical protein